MPDPRLEIPFDEGEAHMAHADGDQASLLSEEPRAMLRKYRQNLDREYQSE